MKNDARPLTLNEARLVAQQMRDGLIGASKDYWPWVVEELCNRIEQLTPPKEALHGIDFLFDMKDCSDEAYYAIDKDQKALHSLGDWYQSVKKLL